MRFNDEKTQKGMRTNKAFLKSVLKEGRPYIYIHIADYCIWVI